MNWLKNSKKAINNFDDLGEYSPLNGFENEQYSSKNPYQQILSSLPKETTTYNSSDILNSNFLKSLGMESWKSNSLGNIPDIPIDSTFYNRKDIYDLQQRLKASGIEVPTEVKDKPGLITRALDLISTPGYVVTTALHNALDGDKDTSVLKGAIDGLVGGLTADDTKYKYGSDIVDLIVGEQKEDAKFGEKAGRFAGGLALDILLDPLTYMTFGASAFSKGKAVTKVGKEVTEGSVKGAIKNIDKIGDLTKAGNVLDLDAEAKRIANIINSKNVKHHPGMSFKLPFDIINKEIMSAEQIADLSNKLGVPRVRNKVVDTSKAIWNTNKSENGIRATIESLPDNILGKIFNDADIRKTMKSDPLKSAQLMASKEVQRQVEKFSKRTWKETLPKIKKIQNHIKELEGQGFDTSKLSSIIEEMKTHNYSKELDSVKLNGLVDQFKEEASKQLSKANLKLSNTNVEARKLMSDILKGIELDYNSLNKNVKETATNTNNITNKADNIVNNIIDKPEDLGDINFDDLKIDDYDISNLTPEQLDNYFNVPDDFTPRNTQREISENIRNDINKNLTTEDIMHKDLDKFEYKKPTVEELRRDETKTYTKTVDDVNKQDYEIYQSIETSQDVDKIKNYMGLNNKDMQKFIGLDYKKQVQYFTQAKATKIAKVLKKQPKEIFNILNEHGYEGLLESIKNGSYKVKNFDIDELNNVIKHINEMEDLYFGGVGSRGVRKSSESLIARLQGDKALFEKNNGKLYNTYKPVTTYEEAIKKFDKEVDKVSSYVDEQFVGTVMAKLEGDKAIVEEIPNTNKLKFKDNVSKEKIAQTVLKEMFGNLKGKGRNNTYKKIRKILMSDLDKAIDSNQIPSAIENFVINNKKAFEDKIDQLMNFADELVESSSTGEEMLIRRYFDQYISNMIDPKSKYFISPHDEIDFKGIRFQIESIFDDLIAIQKRFDGNVDSLFDGTSFLLEGNMPSIYSLRARLNGTPKQTVKSEGMKYANSVITGRGLNVKTMGSWDKEAEVLLKQGDGTFKLTKLRDINNGIKNENKKIARQNKKRVKAGLEETPLKKYKKITDFSADKIKSFGGFLQQYDEAVEEMFDSDLIKDYLKEFDPETKFYELPEKKQKALMKKIYDKIDNMLDAEYWKGGSLEDIELKEMKNPNKAMLDGQNKSLAELSKLHNLEVDERNMNALVKNNVERTVKLEREKGIGYVDKEFRAVLNNIKTPEQIYRSGNIPNDIVKKLGINADELKYADVEKIQKEIASYNKDINDQIIELTKRSKSNGMTYKEIQDYKKQIKALEKKKLKEIKLNDLQKVDADVYKMRKLNEIQENLMKELELVVRKTPKDLNVEGAKQTAKLVNNEAKSILAKIRTIQVEQELLGKGRYYSSARKLTDLSNKEMVTLLKKNNIDLKGVNFADKDKLASLIRENGINFQKTIEEVDTTTLDDMLKRTDNSSGQFMYKEEPKEITFSKEAVNILNNMFSLDDEVREKILKPSYKSAKAQEHIKNLQEMYLARRKMMEIRSLDTTQRIPVKNAPEQTTKKAINEKTKNIFNQNGITNNVDNSTEELFNNVEKSFKTEQPVKETIKEVTPTVDNIKPTQTTKKVYYDYDFRNKTVNDYRDFLRTIGVKNERMNELIKEYNVQKNIINKAQKVLDFSADSIKDTDSLRMFVNNMENVFGTDFIELENNIVKNIYDKYNDIKKATAVPKTPIELINDNSDVLTKYFGDNETAREFMVEYTNLMKNFASTEKEWGIIRDTIDSHGYVPHRLSQEAMDKLGMTDGLTSITEAIFNDRKNLKYNDPKFAKSRTINSLLNKGTIEELNKSISKYLKETRDIDIKNFFETDLTRLIIQRTYEHSDALYQKGVNKLYLETMGTKLDWIKNSKGDLFNYIEDVSDNGFITKVKQPDGLTKDVDLGVMKYRRELPNGKIVNDFSIAIKRGEFDRIRHSINNFTPRATYLSDETLTKVKAQANRSLDNLINYINAGSPNKAHLEKLKNQLYQDLPQRGLAREFKDLVKRGEIKLIYPEGEFKEVMVDVAKEGTKERALTNNMFGNFDYSEITPENFEKMALQDKQVPVYAVDSKVYDGYVKSMKKQFKEDKNAFLNLYDKITNAWKTMAVTSPGFHVRNNFGNYAQSYLDVGMKIFNPKYNDIAKGIKNNVDDVIIKSKNGTELTGKQLNELFDNLFGQETQIGTELNKVRRGRQSFDDAVKELERLENGKSKNIFELSERIGENIEQHAKRRHFAILMEEGLSPLEARDRVNKYLFDYGDLTEFETNVMKRLVPFYTFMRKNMELQLDTLLTKPHTVNNARRMLRNQREASVSSENRELLKNNDMTKVILPSFNGKQITYDTNLPWFDNKSMLGSLNPIIKTPLEYATNKNFTYGNDIESYGGQVKEASPLESLLGGILGKTEIGADGEKYIDAKTKHIITNALPSVRTVDRSIENFSTQNPIEALMTTLGLGGQEFSVDKRTSHEVRELKELLENLESKAQSMGIDTRERLKQQQELETLMKALNINMR